MSISSVLLSHQIASERQMSVLTADLGVARLPGGQQSKILFQQFVDSQKTVHPQEVGTIRNLENGDITPTGNPIDIALNGPGYFKVLTPEGVRYTRNGRGILTAEGQIGIGKNGLLLMDDDSPLTLPQGAGIEDLQIGSDRSVKIRGELVGNLGVARFENPQRMVYLKNDHMFTSEEEPLSPISEDGKLLVQVQQGAYESANVSSTSVLMAYMETNRKFQATEEFIKKIHRDELETIGTWLKVAA